MFALIIAIVSIALIVTLVALSSYYGGSTLSNAQAQAEAVRLKNEEQQILGAVEVFNADHGRWPNDVQELVGLGYLTSVPKGAVLAQAPASSLQFVSSAFAQVTGLGWAAPATGQPIFATAWSVPQLVCSKYNLISRGDDGILKQPFETLPAQCYGTDGAFRVVVTKTGAAVALSGALGPEKVLEGGLPGKDSGDIWWDTFPKGDIKAPVDPEKVPYAQLTLHPASSVDFGDVQLGFLKSSGTQTVINNGNTPAKSVLVTAPSGFSLTSNSCPTDLAPGASCSFAVQFNPTSAQAYAGNLTVNSSNGGTAALALTGVGRAASGSLSSPSFGNLDAGTSVNLDAVLVNTGVGPLTLSHPTVTGAGFEVVSEGACFGVLGAGASCTVTIRLTADGTTTHNGLLTIPSAEAGNLTVSLRGQSQQATLSLSPTARAFGSLIVGQSTTSAAHTVTNSGNIAATGLSISAPTGYSIAGSTCSTSLGAGASCAFTITFSPSAAQPYSGSVTVASGNAGSPTVAVSGTGVAAQSATLTAINFGARISGTSMETTSTLRNTGVGPLSVTVPDYTSVSGSSGLYFSSTTCSSMVAAGGSCTITVRYTAYSNWSVSGALTIATGAGILTAPLSGQSLP